MFVSVHRRPKAEGVGLDAVAEDLRVRSSARREDPNGLEGLAQDMKWEINKNPESKLAGA